MPDHIEYMPSPKIGMLASILRDIAKRHPEDAEFILYAAKMLSELSKELRGVDP